MRNVRNLMEKRRQQYHQKTAKSWVPDFLKKNWDSVPTRHTRRIHLKPWSLVSELYIYDKLVVKFGFPYSPTACLRPHNLVHVPTPAYAPKGNAYIHNDQCQPPDKSLCLLKKLCSVVMNLAWSEWKAFPPVEFYKTVHLLQSTWRIGNLWWSVLHGNFIYGTALRGRLFGGPP